jgi:hypothetical protein
MDLHFKFAKEIAWPIQEFLSPGVHRGSPLLALSRSRSDTTGIIEAVVAGDAKTTMQNYNRTCGVLSVCGDQQPRRELPDHHTGGVDVG